MFLALIILFRVAMNVIFPLFGLLEFRWLSKNRGRFVNVPIAVSRTGSVGSVMPESIFPVRPILLVSFIVIRAADQE
jgi:hypothetical protein